MKITNTDTSVKNFITFTMEIGPEEFEEAVAKAFKKNAGKLNVAGFRKGKAPRKIVEKMFGEGVFYEDAINMIYPKAVDDAIKESGVDPVDKADVNILSISKDEGVKFDAKVPLCPVITLGQYKELSAEKPDDKVGDNEIDAELARLRERNSRQEAVKRKAKMGDTVVFDFEGFVDGEAFEGGKAEQHSLELGAGRFIPGFEEGLVGVKKGESRDINVTFPEEYTEPLAGKPAVFKCVVHEVREKVLPELDDELAKDVSEFDTLDELKASIRERLEKNRAEEAKREFESKILDKLLEGAEVEVHDFMIERQKEHLMYDFANRMNQSGIDFESYISMTGQSPEEFRDSFKEPAERQIKLALAFEKIAELEKVEVSDEEIEAEYVRMAEAYKTDLEKVKKSIAEKNVKDDLVSMKAKKIVLDTAVNG